MLRQKEKVRGIEDSQPPRGSDLFRPPIISKHCRDLTFQSQTDHLGLSPPDILALGDPPHPGFRPHLCAYDPLGLCDLLSSRPPPPVADDLPKDFARDQNDLKE